MILKRNHREASGKLWWMQKEVIWLYRGQPHLLPLQLVQSEMEPRYWAVQLQRCTQQQGRTRPCREVCFICSGQDSCLSHEVPDMRNWYLHCIIFSAKYSTITHNEHICCSQLLDLCTYTQRNTHDAHASRSTSVNKHNASTNFCSSPYLSVHPPDLLSNSHPTPLYLFWLHSLTDTERYLCINSSIFLTCTISYMQDPYHIILKSSDHMEDYVSMKKHVPYSHWNHGEDRKGNRLVMPSRN